MLSFLIAFIVDINILFVFGEDGFQPSSSKRSRIGSPGEDAGKIEGDGSGEGYLGGCNNHSHTDADRDTGWVPIGESSS